MKEFFNNPKLRNGYFWLSLIALIFSAAGIDFQSLTDWNLFGQALLSIVNNPVSIVAVVTAMLGIWNNNSEPGLDKLKQPKEKE